jgi:uncharacterized protein YdeI (YjbR/CyaY-like superfamily)
MLTESQLKSTQPGELTRMKKFESVQAYLDSLEQWSEEIHKLREIVLSVGVDESLKWSLPVYSANGQNVVGLSAMKSYFGLWFFQGALLKDPDGVLINAQEGKTKAMRQWRFQSKKEIKARPIKKYVLEAIVLAEQGKSIKPARNKPLSIPPELTRALALDRVAKASFAKMSKSCQREYAEYIAEAKRDETKLRRIEKIMPMIVNATGLNDKYRK